MNQKKGDDVIIGWSLFCTFLVFKSSFWTLKTACLCSFSAFCRYLQVWNL